MKNKFLKLSSMMLATMMLATGCGGSDSTSSNSDDTSVESGSTQKTGNAQKLTIGTGGTTGTYYTVGGTMGTVLNDVLELSNINVVSSGASKSNIFDLDDGIFDLAIVQNDCMDYAMNGTDLFEGEGAITSFSAIAGIYDETCQIITTPGIKSVADLEGKVINVGDAGSGTEFNATQILAAFGLDINTDVKKVNGSFSDAANALKDGQIDAAFVSAGAPTTAVVDLALSNQIHVISIDTDEVEDLIDMYPFYTQTTIPAGTYNGVNGDAETVSVRATLVASNDLSEDVVYELTKALFENKDRLEASNAKFAELDPEKAVQGISVPFHPGAEKYFREIGIIE